MKMNLTVSSSPHLRAADDTRSIMLDVIISLVPALIASAYFFGVRVIVLVCVCVASCVFFEWLYRKLMKKDSTVGDLSAVVTGMLLAFTLPASIPYWVTVVGAAFAIVIVKQLYGGIGKNFMNPALAARAFLFSWPVLMTNWTAPMDRLSVFSNADAVTSATPLEYMKTGLLPDAGIMDAFLGNVGGSLGETSALLLLLGGVYLLVRKVITPRIPVAFIGTVAVLTFIFPRGNDSLVWMAYSLCTGGLMLGAIFMATDYVTSPVTPKGQWIYGIGCGVLTVFIRYFGSYAEGVSYAILVMNACVWLIDKIGRPKRFGALKKGGASK